MYTSGNSDWKQDLSHEMNKERYWTYLGGKSCQCNFMEAEIVSLSLVIDHAIYHDNIPSNPPATGARSLWKVEKKNALVPKRQNRELSNSVFP